MREVFISHAGVDKPLVEAITIDLLETGIGFNHNQIYCTSLDGQGIPAGVDFKQHIKDELAGATVVISIITPSYYASSFCLCELGATWVFAKQFLPLLVPPITTSNLEGVLKGVQCIRINEEQDLDQYLYDALKGLASQPTGAARWNTRRTTFLKTLPKLLKALQTPSEVKPEEIAAIRIERDEYKKLSEDLDEQLAETKTLLKEVKALKDRTAVAAIERAHSSEWDQLIELIKNSRQTQDALQWWGAKEAFFSWMNGEEWRPSHDDWDDADKAQQHGFLLRDREDNMSLNESKPKVMEAMNAFTQLERFVDSASPELIEQFEEQYKDELNVRSRDFWKLFK